MQELFYLGDPPPHTCFLKIYPLQTLFKTSLLKKNNLE